MAIRYTKRLAQEELKDLLAMTPLSWTAGEEHKARFLALWARPDHRRFDPVDGRSVNPPVLPVEWDRLGPAYTCLNGAIPGVGHMPARGWKSPGHMRVKRRKIVFIILSVLLLSLQSFIF